MSKQTPSQTIGPYFSYGLLPREYGYPYTTCVNNQLVNAETAGQRIRLVGHVFDGDGEPINDAMLELWQANAAGRYNARADRREKRPLDLNFRGFGRAGTDLSGFYEFTSIKPGAVSIDAAPCILVIVFMRGLLCHLYTRIYFDDEEFANTEDSVLKGIPSDRRQSLIARLTEETVIPTYRFDIHMQGERETVFFDV